MLILLPQCPEFDLRRVNAIRSQISENNYALDPEQIADKIIDFETALYPHLSG